jgi:hypothetical protein
MNDAEILKGIRKYFAIHELVGRYTFKKYGEAAWKFLDFRLLWALLIIRTNLNKKITANTWFWGGRFSQRGLRSNLQQIFSGYFKRLKLYLSGHVLGKGIDFDVEGMCAEEVRQWIVNNEDLFPFKIRLEKDSSWVHLDVIQDESKPKIYLFNV